MSDAAINVAAKTSPKLTTNATAVAKGSISKPPAVAAMAPVREKSGLPDIHGGPDVNKESAVNAFMQTMRKLAQNKDGISPERRRVYYQFLMCITKQFSPALRKSLAALQAISEMLCSAPKKAATRRLEGNSLSATHNAAATHDCDIADIAGNILFFLYQEDRCWPLPLLDIYLKDVLAAEQSWTIRPRCREFVKKLEAGVRCCFQRQSRTQHGTKRSKAQQKSRHKPSAKDTKSPHKRSLPHAKSPPLKKAKPLPLKKPSPSASHPSKSPRRAGQRKSGASRSRTGGHNAKGVVINFGNRLDVERRLARLLSRLLGPNGKRVRTLVLIEYLTVWCKHSPRLRKVATMHLDKWLTQTDVMAAAQQLLLLIARHTKSTSSTDLAVLRNILKFNLQGAGSFRERYNLFLRVLIASNTRYRQIAIQTFVRRELSQHNASNWEQLLSTLLAPESKLKKTKVKAKVGAKETKKETKKDTKKETKMSVGDFLASAFSAVIANVEVSGCKLEACFLKVLVALPERQPGVLDYQRLCSALTAQQLLQIQGGARADPRKRQRPRQSPVLSARGASVPPPSTLSLPSRQKPRKHQSLPLKHKEVSPLKHKGGSPLKHKGGVDATKPQPLARATSSPAVLGKPQSMARSVSSSSSASVPGDRAKSPVKPSRQIARCVRLVCMVLLRSASVQMAKHNAAPAATPGCGWYRSAQLHTLKWCAQHHSANEAGDGAAFERLLQLLLFLDTALSQYISPAANLRQQLSGGGGKKGKLDRGNMHLINTKAIAFLQKRLSLTEEVLKQVVSIHSERTALLPTQSCISMLQRLLACSAEIRMNFDSQAKAVAALYKAKQQPRHPCLRLASGDLVEHLSRLLTNLGRTSPSQTKFMLFWRACLAFTVLAIGNPQLAGQQFWTHTPGVALLMHLLISRRFGKSAVSQHSKGGGETLQNTLRVSRWGAGEGFCLAGAAGAKWIAQTPTPLFQHVVAMLQVLDRDSVGLRACTPFVADVVRHSIDYCYAVSQFSSADAWIVGVLQRNPDMWRNVSPEAFCHLLMLVFDDARGAKASGDPTAANRRVLGKLLRDRWLSPAKDHGQKVAYTLRVLVATYCGYDHKHSGGGTAGRLQNCSARRKAMAKRVLVTVFASPPPSEDLAVLAAMKKISSSRSFPLIKAEVSRMLCWAVKFESDWRSLREHVLNLFAIAADTDEASALSTLTQLTDSHWFKARYILHRLRNFEPGSAVGEQGGRLVSRLVATVHKSIAAHGGDDALCCGATLVIACAPLRADEACAALATEMCSKLCNDVTRLRRLFGGSVAAKLHGALSGLKTDAALQCLTHLQVPAEDVEALVDAAEGFPQPEDTSRCSCVVSKTTGIEMYFSDSDSDGVDDGDETGASLDRPGSASQLASAAVQADEEAGADDCLAMAERIVAAGSADGLGVMFAACPLAACRASVNHCSVESEVGTQPTQLTVRRCTTESALERFGTWLLDEGDDTEALTTLRCLHVLCMATPASTRRELFRGDHAVLRLLHMVVPALGRCASEGAVREAWRQLTSRLLTLGVWREAMEVRVALRFLDRVATALGEGSGSDTSLSLAAYVMRCDLDDAVARGRGLCRPSRVVCVQLACASLRDDLSYRNGKTYQACARLAQSRPSMFVHTFLPQLTVILRDKAYVVRVRDFLREHYDRLFLRALLVLDLLGSALFVAEEWPSLACTLVTVLHTFADHCRHSYSAVPATIRAFVCKFTDMMCTFAERNAQAARQLLLTPRIKAMLLQWAWPPAGVGSKEDPPSHPNDTKALRAEAQALYGSLQSLLRRLQRKAGPGQDVVVSSARLACTQTSFASVMQPATVELGADDLATARRILVGSNTDKALNSLRQLTQLVQRRAGIMQEFSQELLALAGRWRNKPFVPKLLKLCVEATSQSLRSYQPSSAALEDFCCRLFLRVVNKIMPLYHTLALQTAEKLFSFLRSENKVRIAMWLFQTGSITPVAKVKGNNIPRSGGDVLCSVLQPRLIKNGE